MNIDGFLARLRSLDINLVLEADELRISAPDGVIDDDLRSDLIKNKVELISALRSVKDTRPELTLAIERLPAQPNYPLTHSQERLWLVSRFVEDNSIYNFYPFFRLKGDLNADAMEQALNEIVNRHDSLRTTFTTVNGEPRQRVVGQLTNYLKLVDLRHLPEAEKDPQVQELIREDVRHSFDLERGPLLRTTLFRQAKNEHVLLINMHHIVTDGWSIAVFFRELEDLYEQYCSGQITTLPALPVQYTDYAVWERKWFADNLVESQMNYWRTQLRDLPVLRLPTDHPRPPTQTYRGADVALMLSAEVNEKLEQLSQDRGGTLFMTLLSAYTILLSRYCDQNDIVVGTPVANRQKPELESLIGFFVNILVLRTDVSGDPTFSELMDRVKAVTLGAYDHQDLPFEKLVGELQPERDLSRNPLFQVIFSLQNTPTIAVNLRGLVASGVGNEIETTRFDFEAHVSQHESGLFIRFVYNPDLFAESTVRQMLNHYAEILRWVSATPDKHLSQLPMLSEQEQQQIFDWNQTSTAYPRNQNVVQLFEAQALATPNATAVADKVELSYGLLNEQANRLAHYLMSQDAGAGVLVAICVSRSIEMVVAQLAVLKSGSAYVPIDPDYPSSRINFMLQDTGAPILLTQSTLLGRMPEYDGITFCLDHEMHTLDGLSIQNPAVQQSPQDLAYVMYTSGSTGEPKGVEVVHGGLTNLVLWHCRTYQVTPADRATHLAGLGFDASVWELWPYLSAGASVHLVPEEQRLAPSGLWSWMASRAISLSFLPTPLAEAALREPLPEGLQLRVLLTGGDRLHGGLVDNVLPFKLVNHYGPTENSVVASCTEVDFKSEKEPSIGRPIDNVQIYILDQYQQLVPVGVPGELYIGGDSLARGYLNRPELTTEKFVRIPSLGKGDELLYRSGDIARYRVDGAIEFIGRIDEQVKLRGFRIELGEIEAVLNRQPGIESSVVILRDDEPENKKLVAYILSSADQSINEAELRGQLLEILPAYMLPSAYVFLDELPLTANGKVNKDALPAPDAGASSKGSYIAPRNDLEARIVDIWKQVLKLEQVGIHDNFFSLGGNSLLFAQVHEKIQAALDRNFAILDLFRYPTVSTLASHLAGEKSAADKSPGPTREYARKRDQQWEPIAIIGMAGRFPGASDVETFWSNLRNGVESITFFSDDELRRAGLTDTLLEDRNFVGAASRLEGVDMFDAKFFGYSPRQAQVIDPQHRFLLECAWEVMERAGYNPDRYSGRVGVYAGAAVNEYTAALLYDPELAKSYTVLDTHMGNDKDFLATRISYNLNLGGPGITLQTSCSTSLVATHLAIQGLREGDCDMSIVGGSSIRNYQAKGYMYQDGGILSPDGHCRAFDANARGTIGGDGTAVVLLKRLEDALADGDQIYAIIKGSAINNDGSNKTGYTAPGVQGQAEAIAAAQAQADVEPRSISYVEAHGTGTALGDPIEVAALTQAFQKQTQDKNFCAIGSLKTNVGHLEAAAGVSGLIKTSMALWHKELPPSLHYHNPNPEIDFANSPFYVNAELKPWETNGIPRRAGVSSFGIGGTNAHVVLEEAPTIEASVAARPWQLLVLSAKTDLALEAMTRNLHEFLQRNPDVNLADVAYTLQVGRKEFKFRRALVCQDVADAVKALNVRDPRRVMDSVAAESDYPAVFMFTGQGSQYPNMGLQLYQNHALYRETIDQCCDLLHHHLGFDLREILYPSEAKVKDAEAGLNRTEVTQSALFVTEYALARLWISWGISPAAMIGHSIGEYVAACLAGVMPLETALELVAARGRLMGAMPTGSMLAVPMSAAEIAPLLGDDLEIATINGPQMCVVSGSVQAVDALGLRLDDIGIEGQRLHTSHAFHSSMMDAVLEPFSECVGKFQLKSPVIPYISNVTGTWITPEEATRPQYYATHLRNSVRFSEGLEQIFADSDCLLLEVGPGHTLSGLAKIHPARQASHAVVSSLRHANDSQSDEAIMWQAIARLWLVGGCPDWAAVQAGARRHRILLPTYPFERQRYWLDRKPVDAERADAHRITGSHKIKDSGQWCYLPVWKSAQMIDVATRNDQDYSGRWLIFQNQHGLDDQLADRITKLGGDVIRVKSAAGFNKVESKLYELNPGCREDYRLLFDEPDVFEIEPARIIHAWSMGMDETPDVNRALQSGFYSLLYLIQAVGERWPVPGMHIDVITNNVHSVTGNERLCPENAFVLGLCNTLRIEYPMVSCRKIDIELPETGNPLEPTMLSALLGELGALTETQVAYRCQRRWISGYEKADPGNLTGSPHLREKGVYLITGGVGGVGLILAEYLAKTVGARLILTGRTELPPETSWDEWLSQHDNKDRTAQKIRKFRVLQGMGAELIVTAADTADREQMQTLIETAQQRFGEIHGVIHAAGVVGGPSLDLIQNLTPELCELQFHPKVHGLLLLKELFADQTLDFVMPVSSISAVLGGLAFAAYSAANQFMDAFSQQQYCLGNKNWISVDWDGWDFEQKITQAATAGATGSFALTPKEGSAVFDRILRMGCLPQVIVSTGDLQWRIEQWAKRDETQEEDETQTGSATVYPRPALSSEYAGPRSDYERILTGIWQNIFGIEQIGINDNFFELGGDSVLNIQITAMAKQKGIMLTPKDAFEHQTIAELALIAGAAIANEPGQDANPDDNADVNMEQDINEDDFAEIRRQQEM